jgi:hypothetical protein
MSSKRLRFPALEYRLDPEERARMEELLGAAPKYRPDLWTREVLQTLRRSGKKTEAIARDCEDDPARVAFLHNLRCRRREREQK